MDERIRIPRTDTGRKFFVEPMPAWGRDASGKLFLRCACGKCMGLEHEIAPNGDVNPSLWHDEQDCGWHVWGTLEDWDGGAA